MDHKKSPNRSKRQAKVLEDYWDCSVCTYRNTAEAFKCLMCDIRKGTSTRKPRINPTLVAQQAVPQFSPGPFKVFKKEGSKEKSLRRRTAHDSQSSRKSWHPSVTYTYIGMTDDKVIMNDTITSSTTLRPRLKNIDRSTAQTREITVNNVTVVITEYKAKKKSPDDVSSTTSEESQTDTSSEARSPDLATDSRSS